MQLMLKSHSISRLQLLHQLSRNIHASLDEGEVHQSIVQEFCHALEGDCAGLLLYNLENQTVAVAAAFCQIPGALPRMSEAPVGLTLRLGTELEYESVQNWHQPWVIQDIDTACISEAERLLLQTAKMHSLLMIPIVDQTKLLGTVYVGQIISCRLWTAEEMTLAELAAEHAAMALGHAQRFNESQQQAQRERALNRIAQRIRTSLDLDTTLNTALAELLDLSKADIMAFAVPTHPGHTALRVTHRLEQSSCPLRQQPDLFEDLKRRYLSQPEAALEVDSEIDLEGYGAEILQRLTKPETVVIPNTQSVEVPKQGRVRFQQEQIGAWLSTAIWYQQKLLGCLIALRPQPYDWTKDERVAMDVIANQLAIAISHRQFYAKTQHQAQKAQKQAQKLTQTLNQLYETQSQLVQSEKMSSLGQLVAGIAHEINNPINFIYGNIRYVAEYAEEILKLVDLYHSHAPESVNQVADSSVDLEFVRTDLLKILSSMRTGSDRIRSLVLMLRNFSRLDEAESKLVNLHEGIDSALLLLKHRLKSQIRVVRCYGDIPLVDSYPGQLNQVFMNILMNAIDAITRSSTAVNGSTWGQLTITTCVVPEANSTGDRVQVRIRDTGPGISPEHHSRVFDPFFTTKPIGEGAGLGLSISYRIVVHKHQGSLWFDTELGNGTEFVIELPITRACYALADSLSAIATSR